MKHLLYLFLFLALVISCTQTKTETQNISISKFIVVDQFGYLPDAKKVAIIRTPEIGFDAQEDFNPGNTYTIVDANTNIEIYKGSPVLWNNGKVDSLSGDKVWHFDFTSVTKEGKYYVYDVSLNVKSFDFEISNNVYKDALKHAFRTFFYQRAGFPKEEKFAGSKWADESSHLGKNQDIECREFLNKDDSSTTRDVRGGWYDAGDYNRYTNWTADYILYLLLSYEENPIAWTDDFGIPESGNGIPDILDEIRFGLEHLQRLQFPNGSLKAVVASAPGSPPSSATEPSYWGGPSTSATLSGAAAFAYGAKIIREFDSEYAEVLTESAENAWKWAEKNPDILFYNNSEEHGTKGLAAGQQEVDNQTRLEKSLQAALRLHDITGKNEYKTFFESNYKKARMIAWDFIYPFGEANQDMLLYYTNLETANPEITEHIKSTYWRLLDTIHNLSCVLENKDSYLAYQKDYVWGANGTKLKQGCMYYNVIQYKIETPLQDTIKDIASAYIHYIHGRNPLSLCYLTNMGEYGAEKSVTRLYHWWFKHGSEKWGAVGESEYGPAPGFVVGGPNPAYDWDGCCPDNCGGEENNAKCFDIDVSVLKNQPAQKAYLDMNNGWPLNSWAISENSGGYQVQYLRLLSKFVK